VLDLLQIFVDNIAPILIIALIGYGVGRRMNVPPKPVGTLIFYVLSPSIVFFSLYASDVGGGELLQLYAATMIFQIIMLSLAFTITRFQQVDAIQRTNVMLSAFCLNAGNYGLSLVAFAFGPNVLSRAAVVFVANVTLNYTLGVYVASNGRSSPVQALGNVATTPAVYAVIAAIALRAMEWQLPLVLERPIGRLAEAAIPMMLLMLGLQLSQFSNLARPRLILTGVGLKVLLAPFLAILLASVFLLEGDARTAFILQASMPTAVLTLVFAVEFDLDRDLALSLILISTLISPLTLSLLILLLR
jgi:malate permease and related proteins